MRKKITPRPWVAETYAVCSTPPETGWCVKDGDDVVADFAHGQGWTKAEVRQHAELLAAAPAYRVALEALVSTIYNTGGVVRYKDGTFGPVGDPDWIDLGDAYVNACRALGRSPKFAKP